MDEADIAQDHIEKTLALQIAQARAKSGQQPTGECLNCSEPLADGRRFCCTECREDFEVREKSRQRSGSA